MPLPALFTGAVMPTAKRREQTRSLALVDAAAKLTAIIDTLVSMLRSRGEDREFLAEMERMRDGILREARLEDDLGEGESRRGFFVDRP